MSWDCGVVAVDDDVVKTPSSSRERRGKDTDSVRSGGRSRCEFLCTQNWMISQLITHFYDPSAQTRLTVKAVRFHFVSSMKGVATFYFLRTQPRSGWIGDPMSGLIRMAAGPFTII